MYENICTLVKRFLWYQRAWKHIYHWKRDNFDGWNMLWVSLSRQADILDRKKEDRRKERYSGDRVGLDGQREEGMKMDPYRSQTSGRRGWQKNARATGIVARKEKKRAKVNEKMKGANFRKKQNLLPGTKKCFFDGRSICMYLIGWISQHNPDNPEWHYSTSATALTWLLSEY